jgi:alditol oxidase
VSTTLTNWARNYIYGAARVHRPASVAELAELVAASPRLKILGTRHSFNDIADTTGELVSLEKLNRILALDRSPSGATVTIEPGVRYGELAHHLDAHGYALPNLASLPHISVAGACATATHGSGNDNRILASSVRAIQVLLADGSVRVFSRDGDVEAFDGAVVGLGGIGAITKLTLDVLPTFDVHQRVYEALPFSAAMEHFDLVTAVAYSVSLFTNWRSDSINQVWLKHRASDAVGDALLTSLGATIATRRLHPIPGISAENCTEQLGIPGPWHERLPHFRMEFTPSAGEELQSEYFVPREHAAAALTAIDAMRDRIAPLLQISEIRTIAADEFWMSPCYRRPSVAIHFTWRKDWPAVRTLLPTIEAQLAPFDARPHWGKLFTMEPVRLRGLYPRMNDFGELARASDPLGKFRNAFLDRYVFAVA